MATQNCTLARGMQLSDRVQDLTIQGLPVKGCSVWETGTTGMLTEPSHHPHNAMVTRVIGLQGAVNRIRRSLIT